MRPRLVLLAAALLALGFAVGLYAGDRVGDEEPVATAPPEPAPASQTATTPPPAASEAPAPAESGDTSADAVEERRPAFSVAPLPRAVRRQLRAGGFWRPGCPVSLDDLRLLTIAHRGFDRRVHSGELVVNRTAAQPLKRAFRELYRLGFPIRHAGFTDFYGPRRERPPEGDVTASFECRQSVPSPCSGGTRSGRWSNHAYGLAVDINPTENPYIGCGQSRDPATRPYRDRSRHRRGMVTPRVVAAFASVGWEWGGSWTGDTKDYMHFSVNGR